LGVANAEVNVIALCMCTAESRKPFVWFLCELVVKLLAKSMDQQL